MDKKKKKKKKTIKEQLSGVKMEADKVLEGSKMTGEILDQSSSNRAAKKSTRGLMDLKKAMVLKKLKNKKSGY